MMTKRKAGWYWVKMGSEWHVSKYRPGHIRGVDDVEAPWSFGILLSLEEAGFDEIGPRIPTPDEWWKTVPAEPTTTMIDAASDTYMPFGDMAMAIHAAIASAPKPEDG